MGMLPQPTDLLGQTTWQVSISADFLGFLGTDVGGGLDLHQDLEDAGHWALEPDEQMTLDGMKHPNESPNNM